MPLKQVNFPIVSEWFNGSTNIITYEIDELMATKLRALYQRRKGRDLFDLWYVANLKLINLERMLEIFRLYCMHDGISISKLEFIKNLEHKKNHPDFKVDMHALLPEELNWNFEKAYQFILEKIIHRMT